MAASISSKKLKKKLTKKILRSQHTLLKHDGITASDKCTNILCVNNGGLDVGVSCDDIAEKFSHYGDIADIVSIPRKPYCFVCFKTEEEAQQALENLNGIELPPTTNRNNTVTLYISYVSKVPGSLCPSDELPPGLLVLKDFVSENYANEIQNAIHWDEDLNSAEQKELKHRCVKHYGYEFKYGINDVDPDDPLPNGIPEICNHFLSEVRNKGHVSYIPDQLTVNKYSPGQGIPPHVDTVSAFEDGIMSLSLGSQVLMDFRHPDGRHLTVLLPPRSLMIMMGESRYIWSHGITPRKSDIIPRQNGSLNVMQRDVRVSLTFRKIIPQSERCNRVIPTFEEIDVRETSLPKQVTDIEKLERDHVHTVYEEIADHFSGTRHTPWPQIVDFLNDQPKGSLMADIGCGNGKYLGINQSMYQIGSDRSKNLTGICRDRQFEVFVGDVLSIPLRSKTMDICICIAVIHHLATEERRLYAVQELVRILRPGGKALIYVWAMEQEINKIKSKYLKELKCNTADTFTDNGDLSHKEKAKDVTNTSKIEDHDSVASKVHEECQASSLCDNSDETCRSKESCCESGITLAVHRNRTEFKQQDLLVPWELKNQKEKKTANVFHRFYHVFHKGELEAVCRKVSACSVIDGYYDQGNWAVILQKHKDF